MADGSKAAHEAYFVEWPNACRKCDAWGGHYSSYDPSPSGVALGPGSMTDFDPCRACVEQGRCGRCGTTDPDWADDVFTCTSCGWKSDEGEGAPIDDYSCDGECKPKPEGGA